MNQSFRLIWSKRLHMLIAVAEIFSSAGKSASGETAGHSHRSAFKKTLSVQLSAIAIGLSLIATPALADWWNPSYPVISTINTTVSSTSLNSSSQQQVVFDGGTLVADGYPYQDIFKNFSVKSTGGTVLQNQNYHHVIPYHATLYGVISDYAADQPGAMSISSNGSYNSGGIAFYGNNTYSGGTIIQSGATLLVGSDNNLGATSGAVTLNGGTLAFGREFQSARDIKINGAGTLTSSEFSYSTSVFSGNISGDRLIVGNQYIPTYDTVELKGINTYTGGTRITGGVTLGIHSDKNLGDSSGKLTLDDGNVKTIDGIQSGRDMEFHGGQLILNGQDSSLSGTISGDQFAIANNGSVTLSSANTYSGGTWVAGGATLKVSADNQLGAAGRSVNIASGKLLTLKGLQTNRNFNIGSYWNGGGGGSIDLNGQDSIFSGIISGYKLDVMNGGTITLAGINTYGGGTQISGGATVKVTYDANLGSSYGAITLDHGTLQTLNGIQTQRGIQINGEGILDLNGQSSTFSGNISGGHLTLTNGGTATLSGGNSYTGGTTVSRGATLSVANNGNLGDSAGGVILDHGTLHLQSAFYSNRALLLVGDGTLDLKDIQPSSYSWPNAWGGDISGDHLTVTNGGMLQLWGNNTYSGGTTIRNGATLEVGSDQALGASAGAITLDNGTLQSNYGLSSARNIQLVGSGTLNAEYNFLNLSGVISGDKLIVTKQTGSGGWYNDGLVTLSGANTYSGGTTVNNGVRLGVFSDDNLGAVSGGLTLDHSTLRTENGIQTARNIQLLGFGALDLNGQNSTVSGAISGDSLRLSNAGSVTLSGANTYIGGTTVGGGATLKISSDNNLGAASGVLTLSNGTLQTLQGIRSARRIMLEGYNNLDLNGQDSSLSGVIAGQTLSVVNHGSVTLSGANTYNGGTFVNSGATIKVSDDCNLGAVAGGLFLGDGTLQTLSGLSSARNITLGENARLDLHGQDSTFSGSISGYRLTITNGGTATLSGDNSYYGGTIVGNGTSLRVQSDRNLGYGDLTLNDGILSVSGLQSSRNIRLNGSGTLNLNGKDAVFSGNISGDHLTIANGGIAKLTGFNTHSGGTTVANGATLQLINDHALGGRAGALTLDHGSLQALGPYSSLRDIQLIGDGKLDLNQELEGDYGHILSGKISGDHLTIARDSAVSLLGDNSYQGGTLAEDGSILRILSDKGLGAAQGKLTLQNAMLQILDNVQSSRNIHLNGVGTVDLNGNDATFSGIIEGDALEVRNGGAMTLAPGSASILSQGLAVSQGTLAVNGELAMGGKGLSIAAGSMLQGSGHISGQVTVAGTLKPGNSPGVMTVAGPVTLESGSTLREDIAGRVRSDDASFAAGKPGFYAYLHALGPSGKLLIQPGVTLAPMLKNIFNPVTEPDGAKHPAYVPALGDTFRIATADGGLSGRFDTLAQPDELAPGTRLAVFYNLAGSNSVDLKVIPSSYRQWLGMYHANVRSTAKVFDQLIEADRQGDSTPAQQALLSALTAQSEANLAKTTQALSGEVHGALAAVAPRAGQWLEDSVSRQLSVESRTDQSAALGAPSGKPQLWIDMGTGKHHTRGDDFASGYGDSGNQLAFGADFAIKPLHHIGFGLTHAETRVSGEGGSGSVADTMAFAYGQFAAGRYLVDALAGYGNSSYHASRVDPSGFSRELESNPSGQNGVLGLGLRTAWETSDIKLEPFARVVWQHTVRDDFSEGTSPAALSLNGYTAQGARGLLGLMVGSVQQSPLAAAQTWQLRLAVGHDGGQLSRPALDARLAGAHADIEAPHIGRAFAQLGLAATARLGRQAYAYVNLTGEARRHQTAAGVDGGLRIEF
ncbi:autotransporter-associated beta strand repeat-containing protein [Chromobacterium alticapitis]|uniref:Autotransporter domain-containing protein n=1 Tax=Chromobacterium alticapitis TaxID=2073169 RepID=A0A2S5DE25_9NEIS|nr:autotransporter-associated beta strand repeat-containing protein [Chromobacterium alticapitis]POZ61232.1 hypothetical protein C2I19_14655 [Chromobacterium alticapitis]